MKHSSLQRYAFSRLTVACVIALFIIVLGRQSRAGTTDHTASDTFAAEAAALLPAAEIAPAAAVPPSECITQGQWGNRIVWTPHIPVSAATLPDGRLLTFASNQRTSFPVGPEFTYAATWNPATGQFVEFNHPSHDMFCGALVMQPDGRVFVNGGRNTVVLASIFDWRTNQWTRIQNMNDPRWYNTSVALPDGKVWTVSGSGGSNTAERWAEPTGWSRLTGIPWNQVTAEQGYINIWHPFVTLAPNGQLFHFGPTDTNHWITAGGNGGMTNSGTTVPGAHYPKEGSWVMYDEGKILVAGGGLNTTSNPNDSSTGTSSTTAYTVDLTGASPVVAPAAPMANPRQFANAVVLPSGEVLVIGGNTSGLKFNDTGSVMTCELWNPRSAAWRTVAGISIPRNYHSLALLLPDGRVLSGGGGLGGGDHQDAQIYTPPCLFNADGSLAARPAITAAPTSIGVGSIFNVTATADIRKFAFIKMSAITHSVNTDLRHLSLSFTENTPGNYQVSAHSNINVMTPGYWMLFALNANGTHSVSKIIRVVAPLTLTAPGNQTSSTGEVVSLQLSATDPAGGTIVYSASGLPGGITINAATGLISGTVTAAIGTVSNVTVTATAGGATDSKSFTWTITQPQGLTGTYYNGMAFQTQVLQRRDPTVEFDWFGGSPAAGVNADQFSVRWTGQVTPAFTEVYDFLAFADDGVRLWVNNTLIIDSWIDTSPVERSGSIALTAGVPAQIKLEYYENGGGAVCKLRWASARTPWQTIPATALFPSGVNRAPTIVAPGNKSSQRGQAATLQLQASDLDGNALTFSAAGLPAGLTLNAANGLISGTVSATAALTNNVSVSVTDGTLSDTKNFVWSTFDALTLAPLTGTPKQAGVSVAFSASSTGGSSPRYKWNFGDGTAETSFSATPTASHVFTSPGRYNVLLTATDETGRVVTTEYRQAIHAALTARAPTASGSIVFEDRAAANDRVWCVNPDNDSVTVFDSITRARLAEIAVGTAPRTLAIAPDGRVWVVNKVASSVSIISPSTLAVVQTLSLPRASKPYGLAFDPDGTDAWIACEETGVLLRFNPTTGAQTGSLSVGPGVRHVSVSADSTRVFVSRFVSPKLPGEDSAVVQTEVSGAKKGGEVVVVNAATFAIERTVVLQHGEQADTPVSARGVPNYLGPAVISPDGQFAWVASKQDNIKRGMLRSAQQLTHESAMRAIVSRFAVGAGTDDLAARVDLDNAGIPSTAAFERTGSYLFTALEGSREVAVVEAWGGREIARFTVGRAPQGLVASPDGRTLYVQNFMDRTVTVHDVGSIIDGGSAVPTLSATLNCITTEKLSEPVLLGKQHFYDARDPRIAFQQYVSCASCHNDGGHDGRIWDFTGFGEGLRNTITLRGHGGTAQGSLHWTGNFDEVQDFENQIRNFGGGTGLIAGGSPHAPMSTPNAGRSADLDALAAYVASLGSQDASPFRNNDGTLTSAAVAGKTVFQTANCAQCHSGTGFTNSALNVFANIGTIKPSSGTRLGVALTGFDVPTLRGLWATGPYLHDGSAATLTSAVQAHQGVTLNATELTNLVAYLQQIDGSEITAPVPVTPSLLTGADIGGVAIAGSTSFNGTTSTYTVRSSGDGIYGAGDAFQFASMQLNGDGEIKARVTSLSNTNPWSKAGVMIRESLTTASRFALAFVSAGNGFAGNYRLTNGGQREFAPGPSLNGAQNNWVRLVRAGSLLSGFTSADGVTWTPMFTATLTGLANSVYVGLAVTATDNAQLATATFDNVQVISSTTPPSPSLLTGVDVGAITIPGSTGHDSASGVYTVKSAGDGIYGTADSFQFAQRRITGDGEIKARVTNLTNTNAWSKAGVMIRESLAAGSSFGLIFATPQNGFAGNYRTTNGGAREFAAGPALNTAPNNWVRIVRSGNVLTAFTSANGSTWTQTYTATIPALPATVYFGLAVTASDDSQLATATFDNVQVTGTPAAAAGANVTNTLAALDAPQRDWNYWLANYEISARVPNADGDYNSDLMEYALGGDPRSGADADGLRLARGEDGRMDASFRFPADRFDVSYAIETSSDLSVWSALKATPIITDGLDGFKTATYPALDGLLGSVGDAVVFLRLRVSLAGGESSTGEPLSIQRVGFAAGNQTLGNANVKPPVFAGRFSDLGSVTTSNCYLEVRDGSQVGHRFDLASNGGIDFSSPRNTAATLPDLGDALIVVRPHATLDDVLDKSALVAGRSVSLSDKVSFYEGGGYVSCWLFNPTPDDSSKATWVSAGNASLANVGARIVAPGEGIFVKSGRATSMVAGGAIRTNAFVQVLRPGQNFIAQPFLRASSLSGSGFHATNGLMASRQKTKADQVLLWRGDVSGGGESFSTLWFAQLSEVPTWVSAEDATLTNLSDSPLLLPNRAVFLKRAQPLTTITTIPAP